jgi:purine-binding chemotaxis protein CheW
MSDQGLERQLVVFTLGSERYALPIQRVHELIRYVKPRSISSTQNWVKGVISLRGRIICVYDLAAHLGIESTVGEESSIVLLDTGSQTLGVIVDGVDEVLTIGADQIEHVPVADSSLIDAIAKLDDRLVVLLKPETVFGAEPIAA